MERVFAFVAGFLIDWISDTLSKGYTDLQTLVKCLDHRGFASDTVCVQAWLCEAAQCRVCCRFVCQCKCWALFLAVKNHYMLDCAHDAQ